jgi:hypothetical protein
MSEPTLPEQIEQNAKGDAQVTVDGMTVRSHPIKDQIEADRYVNGETAAAKNYLGLRFAKLQPPGAG